MIIIILNVYLFLYICFVLTNLKSIFDLKIIEITKPNFIDYLVIFLYFYVFIFLSRILRIISSDLRFLDLKIFLSKYYLLFCNNLIISLNIFFFFFKKYMFFFLKLSIYNIYYTYMYNIYYIYLFTIFFIKLIYIS